MLMVFYLCFDYSLALCFVLYDVFYFVGLGYFVVLDFLFAFGWVERKGGSG